MSIIRIVGIDPGFANTGLAALDVCTDRREVVEVVELQLVSPKAAKLERTLMRKSSDDIARARATIGAIRSFVARHSPKVVFTELMDWGASGKRTVFAFGVCYGMIASIEKPQVMEMTPEEVKAAAGLRKDASKPDMIRWAASRYPNAEWKYAAGAGTQTIPHPDGVRHLHKDCEHLADAIAAGHAGLLTPTMIAALDMMG